MTSTDLITQALTGALKPATPVEKAVQAGWPGQPLQVAWNTITIGGVTTAVVRIYVSYDAGSRLGGTLTISDRPTTDWDVIVGTEKGNPTMLKLEPRVLQAVLA